MKGFALGLGAALLILTLAGAALARQAAPPVEVILFWGDGCPHCADEKAFLDALAARRGGVSVRGYEVWKDPENARVFRELMGRMGVLQPAVPVTLIGNRVFMGFSEATGREIEAAIEARAREAAGVNAAPAREGGGPMELPLLGTFSPREYSLPLLTIIVAGLDSFNPCAMYVLLFLLSFMIHARSRLRMLAVGGVYLLVSGGVYFLFMAAWLNVFLIMGHVGAVTAMAGGVALLVGAINVKDYFAFKRGVSLTLSKGQSGRLVGRMRGLVGAGSLPAMLAGTVALAVAANLYELLCTAGFPMLYTRVLTLRGLSTGAYYGYLALYNVVYVLPLAVVVAVFTVTLGARKMTEREGRALKLVSGLMMLGLGGVLVAAPGAMGNPLAGVAILVGALLASWAVVRLGPGQPPQ